MDRYEGLKITLVSVGLVLGVGTFLFVYGDWVGFSLYVVVLILIFIGAGGI